MSTPHFVIPSPEKREDVHPPHNVKISQLTHFHTPEPAPAPPKKKDGLNVGRWIRRSAAVLMVLAALWWLAFPAFFAVSHQAVLNVRTAQIRSPLDGIAMKLHHDIGDRIEAGTLLAELNAPDADKGRLGALQTRRSEIGAKIKRLTFALKELKPAAASSQARHQSYQKALVANLDASAQETRARLAMAKINHEIARKRLDRIETLRARNTVAVSEFDDASEQSQVAEQRIVMEQFCLQKIQANLLAARDNSYVAETSYFHQRAEELTLRVPEMEAELTEMQDLFAAVEQELAQESRRLEQQRAAGVKSPVGGVIWTRHGNHGQMIKQNETIYDIATDSTLFVEALLPQRYLTSVGPGCRATINLTGGRTLSGKVRAVRTIGPVDNEPSFALKLADSDLKQVRVIVDFDELPQDASILIGRHVTVMITGEEPSWSDRVAIFLFSNVRL